MAGRHLPIAVPLLHAIFSELTYAHDIAINVYEAEASALCGGQSVLLSSKSVSRKVTNANGHR